MLSSLFLYYVQETNLLTVHVPRGKVLDQRQETGNSINALAVRPIGAPMLATAGVF
jgi:hypothetical protein